MAINILINEEQIGNITYRKKTRSPAVAKLGWPHQRENAVSDGGGITRPWLWRSSDANLVMKFGTNKLEWMGYIPAKFRNSSSRISWFAHRRFLPPARLPGGNRSAIYPLMQPTMRNIHKLLYIIKHKQSPVQCRELLVYIILIKGMVAQYYGMQFKTSPASQIRQKTVVFNSQCCTE